MELSACGTCPPNSWKGTPLSTTLWNPSMFPVNSVMPDSVTPRTVARRAPLSMEFPRQGHWRGWPCPPPGDLPNARIEPVSSASPALQGDSSLLSQQGNLEFLYR